MVKHRKRHAYDLHRSSIADRGASVVSGKTIEIGPRDRSLWGVSAMCSRRDGQGLFRQDAGVKTDPESPDGVLLPGIRRPLARDDLGRTLDSDATQALMESIRRHVAGSVGVVVDLGCGSGRLSNALSTTFDAR